MIGFLIGVFIIAAGIAALLLVLGGLILANPGIVVNVLRIGLAAACILAGAFLALLIIGILGIALYFAMKTRKQRKRQEQRAGTRVRTRQSDP